MTAVDGRHSVSVAGVIVDDRGRVLLTQRADNEQWQAPGGVLELNEGIADGLCREVFEETGLTVEPVALTGVYKNMAQGIVALVFRCRPTGGQLTLNNEVKRFHWATPDEIPAMVTEAFAVRVLDALSDGVPAIREHDGVHLI